MCVKNKRNDHWFQTHNPEYKASVICEIVQSYKYLGTAFDKYLHRKTGSTENVLVGKFYVIFIVNLLKVFEDFLLSAGSVCIKDRNLLGSVVNKLVAVTLDPTQCRIN